MVFMTTYVNYTMRSNMSIAIVSMVKAQKGKVVAECIQRDLDAATTSEDSVTIHPNATTTTTQRPELPNVSFNKVIF
nr:unnamed protein product [Callosobruchus analis]